MAKPAKSEHRPGARSALIGGFGPWRLALVVVAAVGLGLTAPSGLGQMLAPTGAVLPASGLVGGQHVQNTMRGAAPTPGLQAVIDKTLTSQSLTSPAGVTLSWGRNGAVEFQTARGASRSFVLQPALVGRSGYRPFSPGSFVFGQQEVTEDLGNGVTAWYRSARPGIEQGFTLSRRPAGAGRSFSIVLSYGGDLRAGQASDGRVVLSDRNGPVLAYGGLRVTDASGSELQSRFSVGNGELRIVVNDARAVYPLTVDPAVTPSIAPSASLIPPFHAGSDDFGLSVALSANGRTALVGAPEENADCGSAFLYTESASGWPSTPTATFTGTANSELGWSVALSADGQTALVGAVAGGSIAAGAAYLYSASSGWSNAPTASFTTAGPTNSQFGYAVALSGDGQTALIGAPAAPTGDVGTAYLYTAAAGWSDTPTVTFTGTQRSDEQFGRAVALSGDGQTALIGEVGGLEDSDGAAFLYTATTGWSDTPAASFSGTAASNEELGASVALSGDGQTALVGSGVGANLYTAASGWSSTPAAAFTGPNGATVALSADGQVALVGAPFGLAAQAPFGVPAAYLYTAASGWSSNPAATFTTGSSQSGTEFASSVALSADGHTALAGAPVTGAAYVLAGPADPTTTSLAVSQSGAAGTDVSVSSTVLAGTTPVAAGTVSWYDDGSTRPLNPAPVTPDSSGTASFDIRAGLAAGSHSIVAVFTPTDVGQFEASQSAPQAFILQPTRSCAQSASQCTDIQTIQATIPVGTLVLSTPYTAGSPLILPTFALNSNLTEYTTTAAFKNITVVDTRAGDLPWTLTALASNLSDGGTHTGNLICSQNVGLTGVTSTPGTGFTGNVTATDNPPATPPIAASDGSCLGAQGLGGTTPHTVATTSAGLGTAVLNGTLTLTAPTATEPGVFSGTITFTVG